MRGNHAGRGGGRGRRDIQASGNFQEKKDEHLGALGLDLLGQETGLRFPERGVQAAEYIMMGAMGN